MPYRHLFSLVTYDPSPTFSVQVNIPAESGEMGVLANHVPSIEQLKPGLVEVVEEGGANKKFFRTSGPVLIPAQARDGSFLFNTAHK